MPQYHVVKNGDSWKVKVNGRTVKSATRKRPAKKKAKKLARKNGGEVIIHRANGVIQNRVSPR